MHKRVGLLGGTFDPIHFGHLNLAIQIQEKHRLDAVLFCPALLSPFKDKTPPCCAPEHRLCMVKLAIEPIPGFVLLEDEMNRPGPSYTIDTIRLLIQQASDRGEHVKFHLILGEDVLENFSKWKESKELACLAEPLIGTRRSQCEEFSSHKQGLSENPLLKGMTPISVMEISSTMVRERLAKRLYCGHLLPAKVVDYIAENQLYYPVNNGK